jgi:DNA-binding NtrC family response regulator
MQGVYKMIGRLATHDVPALIVGERGTGKQLVAATIHANSSRRDQPFVSIDASALSDDVIEPELAAAGAGTAHLASVHALPRAIQIGLARTMDERGGRLAGRTPLDARIIASTDVDLSDAVANDRFSRELFEALGVVTLRLPPLRERKEDIPVLTRYFIQRFNEELDRRIAGVDDEMQRRLQDHHWPGNVGELESVIKRACIVTRSDVITLEDIGESISESRFPGRQELESVLVRAVRVTLQERIAERNPGASSAFHDIVDLVEMTLAREALVITNGNQVKAAEVLGVNRATLRKKTSN